MDQEPRRSYICRKKFSHVLQFKIGLKDIRPPIWRRIQVPEIYTFWDLHVAVQDAMGWQDQHLHEWLLKDQNTGEVVHLGIYPAEFEDEPEVTMDWEIPIQHLAPLPYVSIDYNYDFGDGWEHIVFFEGRFPKASGKTYPCCTEGQRTCPPEDVGGPDGYQEFLSAVKDPKHPDHEDMSRWCDSFDPDAFSSKSVKFWNPETRFKMAFEP